MTSLTCGTINATWYWTCRSAIVVEMEVLSRKRKCRYICWVGGYGINLTVTSLLQHPPCFIYAEYLHYQIYKTHRQISWLASLFFVWALKIHIALMLLWFVTWFSYFWCLHRAAQGGEQMRDHHTSMICIMWGCNESIVSVFLVLPIDVMPEGYSSDCKHMISSWKVQQDAFTEVVKTEWPSIHI